MPFVAEQYKFYDPPRRYFWMEATRGGLPVEGLHAYGETDASMRIRLLSLLPVVRVEGPQIMHSETVTLLNDACLFAPGSRGDDGTRTARRRPAMRTKPHHQATASALLDDRLVSILADLRAMGSERNRAGMVRYGINVENAYGVSVLDLRKMARRLGTDHDMALALWATGNHRPARACRPCRPRGGDASPRRTPWRSPRHAAPRARGTTTG
jgi:hypothetical protein